MAATYRDSRNYAAQRRQVIKYLGSKRALVRVLGDMGGRVVRRPPRPVGPPGWRRSSSAGEARLAARRWTSTTYSEVLAQCYLRAEHKPRST